MEKSENKSDRSFSRQSSISSISSNKSESEYGDNDEYDDHDKGVEMEETSKGKVKGSVSLSYFTSGAHWSVVLLLATSFIIVQMLASGADYWVSVW